jgi:hypothetical protein
MLNGLLTDFKFVSNPLRGGPVSSGIQPGEQAALFLFPAGNGEPAFFSLHAVKFPAILFNITFIKQRRDGDVE